MLQACDLESSKLWRGQVARIAVTLRSAAQRRKNSGGGSGGEVGGEGGGTVGGEKGEGEASVAQEGNITPCTPTTLTLTPASHTPNRTFQTLQIPQITDHRGQSRH